MLVNQATVAHLHATTCENERYRQQPQKNYITRVDVTTTEVTELDHQSKNG